MKKLQIKKTTKLKQKVEVEPVEVIFCAGCGEQENESSEPWIGCSICQTWYEVSCAGMLGKAKEIQDAFVCIDCQ